MTIPKTTFALVLGLLAAATSHAVGPALVNPYTAETTYRRLLPDYPLIRMADPAPPIGATLLKAHQYASDLQLDLYLPAIKGRDGNATGVTGPAPLVVLVHGGGWRSGDRHEMAPLAARLAARGYAAATVDYRLSGQALYPAAIEDVKESINWLRSHAQQFGIDPRRVAVAGGSAGGQIASLVGVRSGLVQAIVNIDGLSDFTSPEARKHEDDPAKNPSAAGAWFGGNYAAKTALWHEASPTFYVTPKTPPILFIGSAQPRFSVGRDEMIVKLKAAGVAHQVVMLPASPHSFWMFDPWLAPTVDAMVGFLDKQFQALGK
jgi:acetyl esterase/lipase